MSPTRAEDLEARLVVMTAFVNGILFELDRDGRYLAVWTGDPTLLIAPADALAGNRVTEFLGPELGETFVDVFRRVIDTGEPEAFEYTLDVPAGRRNFRCEARRTPLAGGAIATTATLLVRDVTEEVRLKAKLVEAERLAAMGLVAASVGHEIRQPLAFATTSLEVLERELGGERSARAREALSHVRDAIGRIGNIAASVGMVAGRKHDPTGDVRSAALAALDLCASELRGRANVLSDLPELPRVRADEGALCQVITNLLLNAAQSISFAEGGKPESRVEVRAERDGGHVTVSVCDDGCGIDPAIAARVFDPFFTTKGPGGGTGLGLFLSRRIVEEAGGTLTISSDVGRGTIARVRLAVAEGAPPAARALAPPPVRRSKLLIIDDEPSFLRSLELLLEDAHEVVVASRAATALALLEADPARFDAILCDLSMPEIDGAAFYRRVTTMGLEDRFVLMSAGAFTPEGEELLRAARCQRIGKPFTLEELVAVLAAVTDRTGTPDRS